MFWKKEPTLLDDAIARSLRTLKHHEVNSPDYVRTLEIVTKLQQMKKDEKSDSVSKDTLATVGANLLGILMIIKYERLNVITSKALSFVLRLR
jgi:hypothetical protein